MLAITKEEFLEIYKGLKVCEYVDLFYSTPTSDLDFYTNFLTSKLWRLNNIYTIVDKYGKRRTFRMNKAQHIVYAAGLKHPRVIILKSRQQGISTLWLVSFFDDAITFPDFSIGLMAQGEDESQKLLERTKLLWDELDARIKSYLNISLEKDNSKEFSFSNKSSIFVRMSFRSTTLQRLHVSEMAKIANKNPQKANETKTGSLQALAQGNTGVVESTAEGDNLFKSMWDNAVKFSGSITPKDFFPVFLSWIDDPDCVVNIDQEISPKIAEYFSKIEKELSITLSKQQKNFWITQYRELGDKIYQEYPSTAIEAFTATRKGNYYAEQYLIHVKNGKRERQDLYDKNLAVQVAVDLGMNDTNVLIAFQEYVDETRMISSFHDNGQKIAYYTDWLKRQPWFRNLRHVILPHDGEVTELTSGKTRLQVFEEELRYYEDGTETGIMFTVLPKLGVNEGIDMVRQMLGKLWIDPIACEYIVDCFYNYTKEWDETREVFRNKPLHNEWSNGADCTRYVAMGKTNIKPLNAPKYNQQISNNTSGSFDV